MKENIYKTSNRITEEEEWDDIINNPIACDEKCDYVNNAQTCKLKHFIGRCFGEILKQNYNENSLTESETDTKNL